VGKLQFRQKGPALGNGRGTSMLKIVRAVIFAIAIPIACPFAQAQPSGATKFVDPHFNRAPVSKVQLQRARFGSTRFAVAPVGSRYSGIYGSEATFDGRLTGRRGIDRRTAWRRGLGNYGDWRQSFSPYWALEVTTELLATAPAYYYYGVGHGNPYGYEGPVYDDMVAYCLQLFRSYDPASGTYAGSDGYRHQCP